MIKLSHLDHFVLTVQNIERSIDFYERVLGMKARCFGNGRTALHFGQQKINLHLAGNEFESKANTPQAGSADVCFLTQTSLEGAMAHIQSQNTQILLGPVERSGAQGKIRSLYVRDPDGNLLEIANQL